MALTPNMTKKLVQKNQNKAFSVPNSRISNFEPDFVVKINSRALIK